MSIVEKYDQLRAEVEALKNRRCEICQHWDDWSNGSEVHVLCKMTDCHWRADESCSRWEAKP